MNIKSYIYSDKYISVYTRTAKYIVSCRTKKNSTPRLTSGAHRILVASLNTSRWILE